MSVLEDKRNKFKKILSVRTYDKNIVENDLMKVNEKISKIKGFILEIPTKLSFTKSQDILSRSNYIDLLNYKKKESLKKLEILEIEYKKYYEIYLSKYREEKKIKTLIKKLNNTIIMEREKKENLFLDEYTNYKVYKELGLGNE